MADKIHVRYRDALGRFSTFKKDVPIRSELWQGNNRRTATSLRPRNTPTQTSQFNLKKLIPEIAATEEFLQTRREFLEALGLSEQAIEKDIERETGYREATFRLGLV